MKIHLDNLSDIKFSTWQKRMQAYKLLKETGVCVSEDLVDLLKADCKNLLTLAKTGKLKNCIEDNTPCDKAVESLQQGAEMLNEMSDGFYDEIMPLVDAYYKRKKSKVSKVSKNEIEDQIGVQPVKKYEKTKRDKNKEMLAEKEEEMINVK